MMRDFRPEGRLAANQEWVIQYPEPGARKHRKGKETPAPARLGFHQRRQKRKPERPERQREEQKEQRRPTGRLLIIDRLPDETFADLLDAEEERHGGQAKIARLLDGRGPDAIS